MSTAPVPLVITYIDPDGKTWNFSDTSMKNGYVCSAISGADGFPFMMQNIPMLDGTAIPTIYIPQPGTIGFAVLLGRPASDSQNDYYNLLDAFVRAFMNRRNEAPVPGTLIIQRPDGTSRQINTYTLSGLDTPDVGKNDMMVYSLSLSTPDPYWIDLTPQQLTFAQSHSQGILPLTPVVLDSSTVLGTSNVVNKGTAIAFPTWTITGPGTPTVKNNTTGRSWSLNTSIPAGQIIQVVTKRGQQQAVNVSTGANIWSQLVLGTPRDLWPLVGGNNSVNIVLTGATAQSQVIMTYYNRWMRA